MFDAFIKLDYLSLIKTQEKVVYYYNVIPI